MIHSLTIISKRPVASICMMHGQIAFWAVTQSGGRKEF
jgi:hypothetical protein